MKSIAIIIAATTLFLGCFGSPEQRFIKDISNLSNYEEIDWDVTIEKFYDVFDWNAHARSQLYAESPDFPEREASFDHGSLRAVHREFHYRSLPLRAVASDSVNAAIDKVEAMFDTVWIEYLRQEYHEDLMGDTYDRVMNPAIINLINELDNQE